MQLTFYNLFGDNSNETTSAITIPKINLQSVNLDVHTDTKECYISALILYWLRSLVGAIQDANNVIIKDDNDIILLSNFNETYTDVNITFIAKYPKLDKLEYLYIFSFFNYVTILNDASDPFNTTQDKLIIDKTLLHLPDASYSTLLHSIIDKLTKLNLPSITVSNSYTDEIYRQEQLVILTKYNVSITTPDLTTLDLNKVKN